MRFTVDVLDDLIGPLDSTTRKNILISHGDPTRPWSGIGALVKMTYLEVTAPAPGHIHFCQRWQGLDANGHITPTSRGHAYFFVAGVQADVGLVLEATDRDNRWAWEADWYGARLHPRGSTTRLVALHR